MRFILCLLLFCLLFSSCKTKAPRKVFDVHLHGSGDTDSQLQRLSQAGVYSAAISSSWELQNSYHGKSSMQLRFGLMIPCPNGKVPYSLQPCFEDGKEWPPIEWVEEQIKNGKIDFFGEILSQYHGISSSDSLLKPYYALAAKYGLPVGVHTGGAGPDHGCPNFEWELGDPSLLSGMLADHPNLKVWIMHGGDRYFKEAIEVMRRQASVYVDISVISNPDIVPSNIFADIMKSFIDAGLEDRLMFGTDNGEVEKAIKSVEDLAFLSAAQKEKIFYQNAERFFRKS